MDAVEMQQPDNHSQDGAGGSSGLAFEEVVSGDTSRLEEVESGKKKKVPRRIIHFVDGDTMEEYSTDEEEEEEPPSPEVDPTQLDWIRWFWYWLVLTATKSLAAADFLGEKLAWFFGITAPKYQYIIDEYHKMREEEEEEKKQMEEEEAAQLAEVGTENSLQNTLAANTLSEGESTANAHNWPPSDNDFQSQSAAESI